MGQWEDRFCCNEASIAKRCGRARIAFVEQRYARAAALQGARELHANDACADNSDRFLRRVDSRIPRVAEYEYYSGLPGWSF